MGSTCCKSLCCKNPYNAYDYVETVYGDPYPTPNAPIIFIIGAPGINKRHIGRRLAAQHGLTVITTSELLQLEAGEDTERGRLYKKRIMQGQNIPANLVVDSVRRKMSTFSDSPGYLIVGFPRNKAQAKLFNKKVKAPDLVIYLSAPRNVVEENMQLRAEANGTIYDTEESIQTRIDQFYKDIQRLLKVNERNTIIVDAPENPEEIPESCAIAIRNVKQRFMN